ncbi:Clp protease N-terminal domain-containing protein [Actinoplanes sp. NPDC049668]|uniref:Clp protease N-terminal domain-containing protein n=1 Tax=unclassified Actinoplanes TaxID=2626549 RepID=UPI0033A9687B
MSSFDHYLAALLAVAAEEARDEGSATIEAHHLLLAIARQGAPVLAAARLDHAAVRAALDDEFARSLAAAGVRVEGIPRATPLPAGSPQLGATAKAALERGFAHARRKSDCRPGHVLLGVLLTQVGTVPRALEIAGADQAGMAEDVRRELAGGGDDR